MTKSILECPHCGGKSWLSPLSSGRSVFQSSAKILSDTNEFDKAVDSYSGGSFWMSDGVTFSLVGFASGLFLLLVALLDGWPAWIAPAGGLLAGVGLHVAKLIIHRPLWARPLPKPTEHLMKIEIDTFDGLGYRKEIKEIKDKSIKYDHLEAVARGVLQDGCNFSRPGLRGRVSQGYYRKIKDEFERLNFCYTDDGNQTHLTFGGRAYLRQFLGGDK